MVSRQSSHLRCQAAAAVLAAAIGELETRRQVTAAPELALTWASRMLEADDSFGTSAGLVVQGDAVPWRSIAGLLGVASYGMLAHRQLVHGGGAGQGCPPCQQAARMWNSALIDPITEAQRITASELHRWARTMVERDLGAGPWDGWRGG